MISGKGAIEDKLKNHKYSQTRSRKKVFELESFGTCFFWRREGVRGDLAQAVRGGSAELRRKTWHETSSAFLKNRGF